MEQRVRLPSTRIGAGGENHGLKRIEKLGGGAMGREERVLDGRFPERATMRSSEGKGKAGMGEEKVSGGAF